MAQINVGVVGYGFSAKVFHLPLLDACEGFNIKSILQRQGTASLCKYPSASIARTIEELTQDSDIELIVITSVNSTHYDYAKKALLAGKNVVVEKPFTTTVAEAQELAEIAKQQKLVLSVYQNRRYDGDFLTVQKLLSSGMLGNVLELHSRFDRFRLAKKPNAWRENPAEPGAGILFDLGPHLIDQIVTLFGKPTSIHATIERQRPIDNSPDDAFTLTMKYGSSSGSSRTHQFTAILAASMITRIKPPRFSLFGTSGSFVKNGLDIQEPTLVSGSIAVKDPNFGADPVENWGDIDTSYNGLHIQGKIETEKGYYLGYYENIRDAIRKTADLYVTPEQAIITMQIIEAAFASANQNSTINL